MGLLNPVTTVLPLRDSLQCRDRDGLFSAIATGPVRYDDNGLIVESGTTNYNSNPVFRNNIAGWISFGQSSAVTGTWSHTSDHGGALRFALASLVSPGGATTHGHITPAASFAPGDPCTASIRCVVPAGMTGIVRIRINARDSGNALIGAEIGYDTPMSEGDHVYTATRLNLPANTDRVQIVIHVQFPADSAIGNFDVLNAQIEKAAHATSFCPQLDPSTGNPLPGYSWAGTPHASVSVRAATVLTFDPAGRVDNDSFAMVGRFSLDSITDGWQAISSAGAQDIGNFFGVFNRDDGRFSAKSNGGYAEDSLTFTPGSPQITYAAGQDTDWVAQLDENDVIAETRGDGGAWSNNYVYVGSSNNGDYLNGSVGPVAFYDRPLTDVELDKVKAAISLGRNPWGLLAPKKQYSFFQLRPGV